MQEIQRQRALQVVVGNVIALHTLKYKPKRGLQLVQVATVSLLLLPRAPIHCMYRSYANALSISIRNRFTYIVRCAVVELCLTQRANPNLQGSKPKSCATVSHTALYAVSAP